MRSFTMAQDECDHVMTRIVDAALLDNAEAELKIRCDDCGNVGGITLDLDEMYEDRSAEIDWDDDEL